MKIKLLSFLLCILIISFTVIIPVDASEPIDIHAERSDYIFLINGTRINLRAYSIEGDIFVNLFQVAHALSGTEKQFTLRWSDRNRVLNITEGVPHRTIGVVSPRGSGSSGLLKPADTKLMINGDEPDAIGYTLSGDIYFALRDIARIFDFCIERFPAENMIDINTSQPFTESTVKRVIDPTMPMVALTFDDGPSFVTEMILDELEKHGAVATFYIVGNRITRNERQKEILLRAHEAGNEIANHSHSHRFFTRISDDAIRAEIRNANDAIESLIGVAPVTMRPPYADMDRRVRNVIAEFGLPIILWSIDPQDWLTRNAETTFNRIMDNVKDKDIILLHDMWEPSGEAAVRLIPALIEKGFQLVTVSELMYYSEINMNPGEVYNSGVK